MRWFPVVAAVLLVSALAGTPPAAAQAPQTGPDATAPGAPAAPRSARPKREPTAGQLAARERMRKCAGEWREAKAKGTTGGMKWPQYWSACNKRMKGSAI